MRRYLIIIPFIIPFAGLAQQKDTAAVRFSNIITASDLKKHLTILASDEYEGRETGMKGQKMAAQYISGQFKSFGIPPLKDGTYYQTVPLMEEKYPTLTVSARNKEYVNYKDYYYLPWQPEIKIEADELVFLGYGINDPKYDDYKGRDVKGKVVMVLSREPEQDSTSYITGNKKLSKAGTISTKLQLASDRGATALIIVASSDAELAKNIEEYKEKHVFEYSSLIKKGQPKKETRSIPVIVISESMANEIIGSSKNKAGDIREKINKSHKSQGFKIKAPFRLEVKKNYSELSSENVLGYIEGSDLKDELVIVTAHYDHLGIRDGKVYNGADDDGSGTVAVIELAQAFAQAKKEGKGPRRSMLFMTVTGEEKGLLGSSYYTENPVFPLDKTVTDLNIDMIGRQDEKHADDPNYIYIIGSNMLSSQLHTINEEANKTYTQLQLDYTYNDVNDKNRYYYRSDHYNFAKNNIPVIFYFNGVHKDYHKETDEVDKINFTKMEKISRLVFFTAWELANRNERVMVDKKENKEK